ncbi:MAG TPA: HAD-IIIC family phosphatase, partial [Myxococcota bacterium]|nr:HAD-IIIC family phosphatase [Myxococcota bacterium]
TPPAALALAASDVGRALQAMITEGQLAEPPTRVLVLGQATTSWLAPALAAWCHAWGPAAVVQEGSFDQIYQDLIAARPGDATVIVLLPWHTRLLGGGRPADARIDDELALWRPCWERVAALGARLVQVGYDVDRVGPAGLAWGGREGPVALVRRMNDALRDALPAGAWFVDLERLAGQLGRDRFYDLRRWFWTRQPFSDEGVAVLAHAVHAGVRSLLQGPRKVLVLDCDNTLWGGVVGETGPLGVQLGETPDGEAFRAFQAWCRDLSRRGVLLAVATKNEPEDARGPFEQNPHMALRMDDLAAFEAGWGPKSESLRRIAQQLNLGLDSFVFFDDNPAEREQVRQALPEVGVVDVPDDPTGFIPAIEAGLWFETLALTAEDAQRAQQYQQERARREHEASFANLDDYLTSLEMRGELRPIDEADRPRVVQLLAKTNQWNLTTRRHGDDVVIAMTADPQAVTFTLRLADRFGDHGLVAVVLATPGDDGALEIDSWLMSCRVIARTAEHLTLAHLVEQAQARGFRELRGTYRPTKKNRQVADLYPTFGFDLVAEEDDGTTRWRLDLATATPPRSFVQRVP